MKISTVVILIVVAASCFAQTERKHIVLERAVANNAPFSEAVLSGNTLYIGGHIGIDPKTGKPGAGAEDEARLVMESVKRRWRREA